MSHGSSSNLNFRGFNTLMTGVSSGKKLPIRGALYLGQHSWCNINHPHRVYRGNAPNLRLYFWRSLFFCIKNVLYSHHNTKVLFLTTFLSFAYHCLISYKGQQLCLLLHCTWKYCPWLYCATKTMLALKITAGYLSLTCTSLCLFCISRDTYLDIWSRMGRWHKWPSFKPLTWAFWGVAMHANRRVSCLRPDVLLLGNGQNSASQMRKHSQSSADRLGAW
jgi:hypothetical protein